MLFIAFFIAVFSALRLNDWIKRDFEITYVPTSSDHSDSSNTSDEKDVISNIDRTFSLPTKIIMPSVVSINVMQQKKTLSGEVFISPIGAGSGVIMSKDGVIVTNAHVIDGADLVQVQIPSLNGKKKRSRSFKAKVLGADPISDIAVIKIEANHLVPARIGKTSILKPGQWILAIGNPHGYENSVSAGIISSLKRDLPTQSSIIIDAIQTDAAINSGNSGGALANLKGELVGIPTAILTNSGGSEGLSFAIPIERALRSINDIVKFGYVKYGWLGLIPSGSDFINIPFNRMRLEQIHGTKLPHHGLIVQKLFVNSPAYHIGVRPLDILLKINNVTLHESTDYIVEMVEKKPNDWITLEFWSHGKSKNMKVRLQDMPNINL